jgi:hypothetical protein
LDSYVRVVKQKYRKNKKEEKKLFPLLSKLKNVVLVELLFYFNVFFDRAS